MWKRFFNVSYIPLSNFIENSNILNLWNDNPKMNWRSGEHSERAVYFLSVVVEQLEESRRRLSRMVDKLGVMRQRDLGLPIRS